MKKILYTILICSFISIGFHLYLSSRSYFLAADRATDSTICNVSESINCDSALASPYSGFAGVPVANWGFATNLIILLLSLILVINWTEKPSLIWFIMNCFTCASAGASLIMLSISSFFLKLFCPFCVILYILSFIIAIGAFLSGKKYLSFLYLKKTYLLLPCVFVVWIGVALVLHLIFINIYDIKSVQKTVRLNVMDWTSAPVKNSGEKALLTAGPSNDKTLITITEFADFLCSHCRNSYYTLKTFKAIYPQIRVEYFSFPLDRCKSNRASCVLTRATFCAEKQNQGWNMHGIIFEHQKDFIPLTDNRTALEKLKHFSDHLSLNWSEWSECVGSLSAFEAVRKQIKAAENMKITGTPALFVNGRKIHRRYFTKTVKAIHKQLVKANKKTGDQSK